MDVGRRSIIDEIGGVDQARRARAARPGSKRLLAVAASAVLLLTGCGTEADTGAASVPTPVAATDPPDSTRAPAGDTEGTTRELPAPTTPPPPPVPAIAPLPDDLPPPPEPPDGLRPLVPGHNRLDADRINLIVSGWGWDDPAAFAETAALFVAWDGHAQRIGIDGRPDPDGADAAFGVFAVEPFRSNRHLFNVWLTDEEPPEPVSWLNTADDPFDLPDQVVMTLALDPDRAVPGLTSVAGQDTQFFLPDFVPDGPDAAGLSRNGPNPFANVLVRVESSYPAGTTLDAPHELGHAMFGLADEYVGRIGGDGVIRTDLWPACAASRERAEEWWGDLVGEVDPMIEVWAAELAAIGATWAEEQLAFQRDQLRVGFVEGGCHGNPGSYRPSEDTLMGFLTPAFGSVNRRWAEEILALWTGRVDTEG